MVGQLQEQQGHRSREDGDSTGQGPCREKGCLPGRAKSTGLRRLLGIGYGLESQWAAVTAAVGEGYWGPGGGKEAAVPVLEVLGARSETQMGAGPVVC